MDVKWMSRDRHEHHETYVRFWNREPSFDDSDQRFFDDDVEEACVGLLPVSLVPSAPEPGRCVPVQDFQPIKVTVKQEPKNWLACESDGSFSYFRSVKPPTLDCGHFYAPDGFVWCQSDLCLSFVNEFVYADHNLQPGQCIEIPPR